MKKAMNKNKNITVEEQFKRRQKEAAIVTSLTFGGWAQSWAAWA